MRREIKNWVVQAQDDLETAEYNAKGQKYYAAAFFCQQSVEKVLPQIYLNS